MISLNTNISSETALRSLQSVSTKLNSLENQASTGLKVSGAADNAGVFAVAQGIRAKLKEYDSVNTELQNAQSLVSTAITGATTVSNLIVQMTQTMGYLADGSISTAQRQIYTVQFVQQLTEVQSVIANTTYDGTNLIGWDLSKATQDGGTYPIPQNISVLSSPEDTTLTLQAQNLTGTAIAPGTFGITGLLGFLRLGFVVSKAGTGADTVSLNPVYNAAMSPAVSFVSRTIINQNEALAALAPVSNSASAFYTSPTATAGTTSVFNSAFDIFSSQVNGALANLSADYSNIQSQVTFNQSLSDTVTDGLGNLVDANLAVVSAQLTATQTRQQLAIQSLSIASSAPDIITQLFKR